MGLWIGIIFDGGYMRVDDDCRDRDFELERCSFCAGQCCIMGWWTGKQVFCMRVDEFCV